MSTYIMRTPRAVWRRTLGRLKHRSSGCLVLLSALASVCLALIT